MIPVVVKDVDSTSPKVTMNSFTDLTSNNTAALSSRRSSFQFMATGQVGQSARGGMPNRSIRALRALENKFKGLSVFQDLVDEALCEAVGGEKLQKMQTQAQISRAISRVSTSQEPMRNANQ